MTKILNQYIYSKIGEWHKAHNQENQDATYFFENEDIVFCAVADGVSLCQNSKLGAEWACELACRLCRDEHKYFFHIERDIAKWLIVRYIHKHITHYAENNNLDPKSFASTLCFVCIEKDSEKMMTFTLGDSRIYLLTDKNVITCDGSIPNREDNLTNTTMTANAECEVAITFEDFAKFDSVLLCTDGAWRNASNLFLSGMDVNTLAEYLESHTITDDSTFLYVA